MFDDKDEQNSLQWLAADFKQRRPKVREPQRLGETISQLFARRGYAQQRSTAELEEAWAAVVGPALSGLSRPGLVRRGILEVFVTNSALLQELTFRKQELAEQLAAKLPAVRFRDLKFRIGPAAG